MKRSKTRLWETQSTTIVSITLVLFVLGLLMLTEYHSYNATQEMQERITYKVDLFPNVDSISVKQLQEEIAGYEYVKDVDYISKEEAAELFAGEIGEDFVSFIGFNPLYPSFMVTFKADMLPQNKSQVLDPFCKAMSQHDTIVSGVNYQEVVVDQMYTVLHKFTWFLILFILLLLLVCIIMINTTIRLSFYTMSETIGTMRLVGATRWFIARPYIWRGLIYGALGGVLADLLLSIVVMVASKQMQLNALLDATHHRYYLLMAVGIIAAGMLITWIATVPAVRKELRKAIQ